MRVGRDSIGVILDEFEASGDPHAMHRILLYWRSCYSGGRALRGGAHHTGTEFITNAVLIAAAIDLAAMDAADRRTLWSCIWIGWRRGQGETGG